MPSLMIPGFTRSLDSAIADQRVRHAAERLDFHAHFEFMTVEKLLRILRKEDRRDVTVQAPLADPRKSSI